MTPEQIFAAMSAAQLLIKLASDAVEKAKERGEWTPQQEAEFDAKLAEARQQAHWKPTTKGN